MEVKIKKLNDNAIIPTYGTEFSAGADLYACIEENILIKSGETVMIKTGISLEIPTGLVGLVYARSGLAFKKGIAPSNKVGVIDSDYRGEIMVALHNHSKEDYVVEKFERIAQLVIAPYIKANFIETDTLNDTVRDQGGFGSTGKK
ncbi:dUTP diphosphatase [Streptobacillus felis]|uniref:Deoxyuridine 5'-triphosphate nucleotidohydrolase n=1 Tax=Streptobacillus felis TaxID=1384509 RepID=A0A7Z0TC73_9FUSO|nr:dUTP diphosphatase [Streptobacillus felis]NYV28103.1 dUTP diphosphatase [Streptobacillus felis]